MDYSTLSIESAIAKVIDDVYPNAVSFMSGSFCCADGWYYLQARTESGKATTGTVQKWKGNDVYAFYRLAGADAVLKKLAEPDFEVLLDITVYGADSFGGYSTTGSVKVSCSGGQLSAAVVSGSLTTGESAWNERSTATVIAKSVNYL